MSVKIRLVDYAEKGWSIQRALVDAFSKKADKRAPTTIEWAGKLISNADVIVVPKKGRVRLEIIGHQPDLRQGIDIEMNGGVVLLDGTIQPSLRTWCDPEFEEILEYEYVSQDGLLRTWNVYEMRWPHGPTTIEKWTGNAGMWVETIGPMDRVYHCSPGMAEEPNFSALKYRLTVRGGE